MKRVISKKVIKVFSVFTTVTFFLTYCFPYTMAETTVINKTEMQIFYEFINSSNFDCLTNYFVNYTSNISDGDQDYQEIMKDLFNYDFLYEQYEINGSFLTAKETIDSLINNYFNSDEMEPKELLECSPTTSVWELMMYLIVSGVSLISLGGAAKALIPDFIAFYLVRCNKYAPTLPGSLPICEDRELTPVPLWIFFIGVGILYIGLVPFAFGDFLSTEPPSVNIISPKDESSFRPGEDIIFKVAINSRLDIHPEWCSWSSSIDGEMGCGVNFIKSDLSRGNHIIHVEYYDEWGLSGEDSINISVLECNLSLYPSSVSVSSGESIIFTASSEGEDCINTDFNWSIETNIGSTFQPNGNTCIYMAGNISPCEESATDTIIVEDINNSLNTSAMININAKEFEHLYSVWGSSVTNVFAVGNAGVILHYDGSVWSTMESGLSEFIDLRGIWGSSGTDVFAVGDNTILHYDSIGWSIMESNTTSYFNGIWGASGTDVFAVANWWDTIFHYDGTDWLLMDSETSTFINLHDVWGSSGTDVFAVGSEGTILHYDGTSWFLMRSGGFFTSNLNAVWGSSGTDVFAVGDNGTILHYDSIGWSTMESGTSELTDLYGIWGSSGTDVFAVGGVFPSEGIILRYDGNTWSSVDYGVDCYLQDVWGNSGTDVFAVGGNGVILHYDGSVWSHMNRLSITRSRYCSE